MTLATVHSRAARGLDAPVVTVEVHLANGLPSFTLVGLADTEVKESRERVRAALLTAGLEFPHNRRLVVNLAPADLPKASTRFDLPIAIGILAAAGLVDTARLDAYEFAGELSLGGELRPVPGALAMALARLASGADPASARRTLVLPRASAEEAALADADGVRGAQHLLDVVRALQPDPHTDRSGLVQPPRPASLPGAGGWPAHAGALRDLRDVRGQAQAKRALEVAAAGRHSLLMVGPPGTGKSMLAERLPGLLVPMRDDEALQAAAVRSLAGPFDPSTWRQRAMRAPHHTASAAALVGGGSPPRPGEASLAHHGVLFLDELPEFPRPALEALREPLETGRIVVARAGRSAEFPAAFQLVAAMNPCPCGHLGSPRQACRCPPDAVARYRARISGPLLDRIDLQVEVPPPGDALLDDLPAGEPSAAVAARVAVAAERAWQRQGCANAQLAHEALERHAALSAEGSGFLRGVASRLGWSGRGVHRVLRVARTLADLDGAGAIGTGHLAEAIQYRRLLVPAG